MPRSGGLVALLIALAPLAACDGSRERTPGPPDDRTEAAAEILDEDAEALAALGYIDVVASAGRDLPLGVLRSDPERVQPGPLFFSNAHGCSAQLLGPAGEELRTWSLEPCERWDNAVLLPNGEVLALHREPTPGGSAAEVLEARGLVKLDWEGKLLWRSRLPAHHDVQALPDGGLATLTYGFRRIPEIDPEIPVRDHYIAILDERGRLVEQQSITELLLASDAFPLKRRRARRHEEVLAIDLIHSNSIEWMDDPDLAARDPLYALGNVLVCLRHQDAVIVVDWERRKLVWSWGRGELSGPHDATVLGNGNILVFDNGLSRKWSRVVEVEPATGRIVWEYRAPEPTEFFTVHRGAAQRLANGNTLVTNSNEGTVFEVTREGEVVFSFRNPNLSEEGKPIVIVRARRVRELDDGERRFERTD